LMLELNHRRDQRRLREALELRILDRFAELPGEGQLLMRRRLLVAQEDRKVIEKGLAHLARDDALESARDIDAVDIRAQGASDRPYFDVAVVAHQSFAQGGGVLAMKCRIPSDACGRRSNATRLLAASSSTARSGSVAQAMTRRLAAASASGSS